MDELGAFVAGSRVTLTGAQGGRLAGLTFAAKDNFDVADHVTGAGNPDWARTHPAASRTAKAISQLLEEGASMAGKAQMNELAWGSLGNNAHFGTPLNSAAPERVPGGSSSGSASAVAGGLVDFALGTDSACSVRLPAAFCGLFGLRPTIGRVSLEGVVPLSASLDTVGWFARDAAMLKRVGQLMLSNPVEQPSLNSLLVAEDGFAVAEPRVAAAIRPHVEDLARHFEGRETVQTIERGADKGIEWLWFRAWSVEAREAWRLHGAWIETARPDSRVLSRENFALVADSTVDQDDEAFAHFARLRDEIRQLVQPDSVLCLPTAADIAPLRGGGSTPSTLRTTLCLMSIAGIGGLPQVTVPAGRVDGAPIGLSLVGPPNSDETLLALACDFAESEGP